MHRESERRRRRERNELTFCRVSILSENILNKPSLLSTPGTALCRSLNSFGSASLGSGVRLRAGKVCSCASFCRLDIRIWTRLRIRHACWNLTPDLFEQHDQGCQVSNLSLETRAKKEGRGGGHGMLTTR